MTDNKLMKKHKCPVCGKKFETNRKDAKTCSPKCRQAMYRDKVERTGAKPSVKPKAVNSKSSVPTVKIRYARRELTGERALKYISAVNAVSRNSGVPRSEIENHMLDYDEIYPLLNLPPKLQKRAVVKAVKEKDQLEVTMKRLGTFEEGDDETRNIFLEAVKLKNCKSF